MRPSLPGAEAGTAVAEAGNAVALIKPDSTKRGKMQFLFVGCVVNGYTIGPGFRRATAYEKKQNRGSDLLDRGPAGAGPCRRLQANCRAARPHVPSC